MIEPAKKPNGRKLKHPIFWDTEERICCICKERKPFSDFSVSGHTRGGFPIPRSDCKPCRTLKVSHRAMERKLEANPEKYLECDNCCKIQSRLAPNPRKGVPVNKLRENCKQCKEPLDHDAY